MHSLLDIVVSAQGLLDRNARQCPGQERRDLAVPLNEEHRRESPPPQEPNSGPLTMNEVAAHLLRTVQVDPLPGRSQQPAQLRSLGRGQPPSRVGDTGGDVEADDEVRAGRGHLARRVPASRRGLGSCRLHSRLSRRRGRRVRTRRHADGCPAGGRPRLWGVPSRHAVASARRTPRTARRERILGVSLPSCPRKAERANGVGARPDDVQRLLRGGAHGRGEDGDRRPVRRRPRVHVARRAHGARRRRDAAQPVLRRRLSGADQVGDHRQAGRRRGDGAVSAAVARRALGGRHRPGRRGSADRSRLRHAGGPLAASRGGHRHRAGVRRQRRCW